MPLKISLFSSIFFLALFFVPVQAEEDQKQRLLENAIEEIVHLKEERNEVKKSADFFEKKYLHALRALNFIREGRYFEGAEELREIEKIDPQDLFVLETTAVIYSELKIVDKAIEAFQKQALINPQNEKIYSNLGFLLAQQGNHTQAIDYYLKALSLNPDFPVTHYNLALTYIKLGEKGRAVEHFKTAASLFEEDSPWRKEAEDKATRHSALQVE